jgi:hypothetical protein
MKNKKQITSHPIRKVVGNKGLLDKKRFESLERGKRRWLRTLSWKKGIRLAEDMLSCPLVDEWLDNFPEDKPICLKMALKKKREP